LEDSVFGLEVVNDYWLEPYDWHLSKENFRVTLLEVACLHIASAALNVKTMHIHSILRTFSHFLLKVRLDLGIKH